MQFNTILNITISWHFFCH